MSRHRRSVALMSAVIVMMLVAAAVIGARSLGTGNLSRARQIAAQLQAEAIAQPNPVLSPAAVAAQPAPVPTHAATTPGPPTPAPARTGESGSTSATKATPSTGSVQAVRAMGTPSPGPAGAKPLASTQVPRRQPTAAEVSQAIDAVHSLIKFYTPTPLEIASAGDQVCTAFDQGQPRSQIESQALDMVGAGSVSWMIPASVTDVAVKTLVALYCPGHAAKLS